MKGMPKSSTFHFLWHRLVIAPIPKFSLLEWSDDFAKRNCEWVEIQAGIAIDHLCLPSLLSQVTTLSFNPSPSARPDFAKKMALIWPNKLQLHKYRLNSCIVFSSVNHALTEK